MKIPISLRVVLVLCFLGQAALFFIFPVGLSFGVAVGDFSESAFQTFLWIFWGLSAAQVVIAGGLWWKGNWARWAGMGIATLGAWHAGRSLWEGHGSLPVVAGILAYCLVLAALLWQCESCQGTKA